MRVRSCEVFRDTLEDFKNFAEYVEIFCEKNFAKNLEILSEKVYHLGSECFGWSR